jgi:hypothetical protein
MKEENKLIAEFMGYTLDTTTKEYYIPKYNSGDWFTIDELLFHESWDWLMPVVEKVESLNFSIEMNKQEEGDYQCLIIKKDILVQTFSNNKIESVYNALINFISHERSI